MQFTRLGSTGTTVSRLCLGMMTYGSKSWREWVLEEEEAGPIIKRALDLGINFFDTADIYSLGVSEEITGRLLKKYGPSRDQIVIATKVHGAMGDSPNQRGLSRKHIMHAIDDSLRRLGVDYVDLYQIHRFDPNTPIEETLEALDDVVKAGKALYIGASSMFAYQFAKMLATSDRLGLSRFVTMQNHYNLLYREEEREMIPLCREEGIGIIPWSPLARGQLARPRQDRNATLRAQTDTIGHALYSEEDGAVIDRVTEVASERGVPNAQVALAWLLAQPGVTAPIIGASRIEHLETAAAAVDLVLDENELKRLAEPYRPHPVLGHG
ncbi:aldo/keto reductase [Chelativorans sp. SCAU2101]|jgi:Predicted oxidoreductases (related to aryl-alcohol dehydrogenases)|uniref:Aldo/keto reductase n=1 Tax=Chelativorans petroleitrophicus TaxID=2975484 RepID=A0A9X3AZH2_9HYPH|nr:aldo/keto reductase [Chelativorans petroleitrophicus]MCT8989764.1 aldo/keto reductase [Chelativorans petroleitrophicus]